MSWNGVYALFIILLAGPVASAQSKSTLVSTVTMEDGTPIPQGDNAWMVSWFNWATINEEDFRQAMGRLESYNYLSLSRRWDRQSMISIRPEFFINGAGRDFMGREVDGGTEIGDIYLNYGRSKIQVLEDAEFKWALRAYYPNGRFSKMQRQIAKFQWRGDLSQKFAHGYKLSYSFRPSYYIQRQRAYINRDVFYSVSSNKMFGLEQKIELVKTITPALAFHQQVGIEHEHYYGSPENNLGERTDAFLTLDTAMSYDVTRQVSFLFGFGYESKLGAPDRPRWIYDASQTSYSLITNVNL